MVCCAYLPGYENKVAATIEKTIETRKLHDLIFAVNIPTETVLEVRENSQKEVERKVFPGLCTRKDDHD